MYGRKVTGALLGLALVAVPATPTQAFFNHCKRCAQPTTTFYAPVAMAPVAVAPAPTVVNYVPQTAFRSVVVNRPVTTMVAQPACGPCGQPTTVMRPVTTFVTEQQLVPYTTFRPVVTAMPVTVGFAPAVAAPIAAPAPACCGATPVPTLSTTNFAPAPVAAPVVAPAPACCGSATPTPSLSSYSPAPTTTTLSPATTTVVPSTTTIVPQGTPGSTLNSLTPTPDPTLNAPAAAPSTAQPPATLPQTFAPQNGGTTSGTLNGTEPQSRVVLPPSGAASSSYDSRPRGLDPEEADRTTAIPLRRGAEVRQASLVVPAKSQPKADDGWRPSAE